MICFSRMPEPQIWLNAVGIASTDLGGRDVAGLGVGGATMLGVLCASASYIAAPAAVRLALPAANEGLAITCALAMTFPVNMVVGIPFIAFVARAVVG